MRHVLIDADVLSAFLTKNSSNLTGKRSAVVRKLIEFQDDAEIELFVSHLVMAEAVAGLPDKAGVRQRAGKFLAGITKLALTEREQKRILGVARILHMKKVRSNTSAVDASNTMLALTRNMEILYLDKCYEAHKLAFPQLKLA